MNNFKLVPFLIAGSLVLANPPKADALLTYTISQSGNDVLIQTSGSLNLPIPDILAGDNCSADGSLVSAQALVCTGANPSARQPTYSITGPASFAGTASLFNADSGARTYSTFLWGAPPGPNTQSRFSIGPNYVSGSAIDSSSTFLNQTLAGLNLTPGTTLGTWTIGTDRIQVVVAGTPPSASVPAPLPVVGAAAAFGWTRRLRRRIGRFPATLS